MPTSNNAKSERVDVRASSSVKLLLQEAARACHKNVSEFLLDAGVVIDFYSLAVGSVAPGVSPSRVRLIPITCFCC